MTEKDKIFKLIGEVADSLGREVYVVGGYVRDQFLGRDSSDYDFVTVGSGIELAKAVATALGHKAHLSVFANYGTAQVKINTIELEFVGARKESYTRDSRNPIVEDGSLQDDLSRRDFTVNALAVCLNKENYGALIDLFDGYGDLQRKLLRTPLDPDITFSDDPLRMLRAIRFASQLPGFKIVTETFEAIKRNASRMKIITRERINVELMKIMSSARPSVGWRLLDMAGLLPYVWPSIMALKGVEIKEGKGHKDNFSHTLQVLDNVAQRTDDVWLRWAALLHDIGKPTTKKYIEGQGWTFHNHDFIGEKLTGRIFKEMKMPLNEHMKYVAKVVGLHMRPQQVADAGVSDSGVRRLITEAGNDLDDLMLLAECDITSKQPEKVKRQLNGFRKLRDRMSEIQDADALRNWKNPINGNEIIEKLGLPPGPVIADMKQIVKDAVLDGIIPCEHDAAWEYLMNKIKASNAEQ